MEIVYSIDFSSSSKRHDFVVDERICCSLSCKNIVAFSRARKTDSEGDKLDICFEVCVVDLDKPWQKYEVTTYISPVTYMRWDPTGTALLVVNAAGTFNLWKMKNYLLNVWEEAGTVELEKEEILVLAWLHSGAQTLFNPESRDVSLYNEKFPRAKMSPSVTQFGKKPVEGWIAVTSTGMVNVGLVPDKTSSLITSSVCLGQANTHLSQADVAFMPDGQVLIATSDGQLSSSVHCYVASITLKNHQCNIRCSASASFFLKKQVVPDMGSHEAHLIKLSFLSRENSEVLLACWGTSIFSCIEVWHLIEQSIPLHKMFQNASVTEYAYKTKHWSHKSSCTHNSGLTGIARPKLPISRSFNMESTNFLSYFACTYLDGSIRIIHRQSYQIIYKASLDQLINIKTLVAPEFSSGEPPEKQARSTTPHLVSAVQTNTGCGLVGLGEGRLYLFRMFNSREGSLQMLPAFVGLLLEYIMFVGLDVWDVLLAVRQGMIEGIVEKMCSNFQKQTGALQELLHHRLLHHKMALFSCLGPGNQRAADCRAMITLHAITTVIKSCLRPKNVAAQDKNLMVVQRARTDIYVKAVFAGIAVLHLADRSLPISEVLVNHLKSPADKLASLCTVSLEMDLDLIAKTLDSDDFVLETKKNSSKPNTEVFLQSLQPIIQWIADFILHLFAAVSMYPNYPSYPGASLLKDSHVLSMIRELLIIMRIWGKHNHACLPIFMTTVSIDPLPYLFRLVTKAWIAARDQSSIESDQTFLDECCSLPSKMLLPNYKKTYGEEMNCYLAFSQPFPIDYQFGVEPDFLFNPRYSQRIFPFDLCLHAEQKYDCVRQTQLGVSPKEPLRECVRCCSLSLRRKPSATKSPLLKAWELRFVKSCLCGGHWKLQQLPAESQHARYKN